MLHVHDMFRGLKSIIKVAVRIDVKNNGFVIHCFVAHYSISPATGA